MQEMRESVHPR